MKRVLYFATKLNSRDIQKCDCLWVPSYDLFASARKAVFPAPMATGFHRVVSAFSVTSGRGCGGKVICHRTSQKIPRKDLQKEMNEEFELITATISLAARAMNENNCRAATGKPAFSSVMQSMSRHVGGKKFFHTVCAKTFMK